MNKITKFLVALLLSLVMVGSSATYAQLSDFDIHCLNIDCAQFVPGGAKCQVSSDTKLIGNDNIEKIFNFFVSKQLTPEQAAGITGNAIAESGGNPLSTSPSGYKGIFQWDKTSRWPRLVEYAKQKNLNPDDLGTQLEYAFIEATGRGNIAGIKAQPTVELAAWYWGRFFEVAIVNGSSSKVPMTNVQALDKRISSAKQVLQLYGGSFVATGSTVATSEGNCSGIVGGGQDTKFKDGFAVYSQQDPAWAKIPYGSSTIGESGCGPTAMAMIITALGGIPVLPPTSAEYASSRGQVMPGGGSLWTISPILAANWGLKSELIGADATKIAATLQAGGLVIAAGRGAKPFTSAGHFIVIRAVTANGKFKIGDSGHSDTSDQEWDPAFLVSNMSSGSVYAITK